MQKIKVGAGHDSLDARQFFGLGSVDADDSRVRLGAAQHLPVEHAGELDVFQILRSSGHFPPGVHTADGTADAIEILLEVRKGFLHPRASSLFRCSLPSGTPGLSRQAPPFPFGANGPKRHLQVYRAGAGGPLIYVKPGFDA